MNKNVLPPRSYIFSTQHIHISHKQHTLFLQRSNQRISLQHSRSLQQSRSLLHVAYISVTSTQRQCCAAKWQPQCDFSLQHKLNACPSNDSTKLQTLHAASINSFMLPVSSFTQVSPLRQSLTQLAV